MKRILIALAALAIFLGAPASVAFALPVDPGICDFCK